MTHPQASPSPTTKTRPGKYLLFTLAGETYGMSVLSVREIIRRCPVTPVANMPPHVRGVFNLRGRVIPLVDLRIRFGLPAAADHDRTCFVVTEVAAAGGGVRPYAVVVDTVEEVVAYAVDDLVPTPDFGGAIDDRFISGMARTGGGVTTLIDIGTIAVADAAHPPTPSSPSFPPSSPSEALS
jgi:purine-binding chemotaxis protein CheW